MVGINSLPQCSWPSIGVERDSYDYSTLSPFGRDRAWTPAGWIVPEFLFECVSALISATARAPPSYNSKRECCLVFAYMPAFLFVRAAEIGEEMLLGMWGKRKRRGR